MLSFVKDVAVELAPTVTTLNVGAGWITSAGKKVMGFKRPAKSVDLDLIAVALENKTAKRICWYNNEDAFQDGSLVTSGDNTTGKGSGDDETIMANLMSIPANIDTIVFVVVALKEGVTFANVEGIDLNVYDGTNKIGSFMVDIQSRHNAIVACKAVRGPEGWSVTVVNDTANARSKDQLMELAKTYA